MHAGGVLYRSCQDHHQKRSSVRNQNGNYEIASFDMTRTAVATYTSLNCQDQGRYSFASNAAISKTFNAPVIVERVHMFSVYPGARRGCKWMIQGSDNGQDCEAKKKKIILLSLSLTEPARHTEI